MHIFLFIILSLISVIHSARILGIVPTPAVSHQMVFRPLWKELSLRGHQVVSITTHPMNNTQLTNLTEIDMSEIIQVAQSIFSQEVMKNSNSKPLEALNKGLEVMLAIGNLILNNGEVQKLINNQSEYFDVVLIEMAYSRAMFALSKRFNCPFIGILSIDADVYYHNTMGNPTHPVLYPSPFLPFDNIDMSFKERFISLLAYSLFTILPSLLNVIYGSETMIMEKYFPNISTGLDEMTNNMSMMFLNVNPIFWGIRPVNPNTILFGGGVHIEKPKPLPKEFKDFLDSNPNGVIYFSLGSNVRSDMLGESVKEAILDTISSLPYKVLWKYESDTMENKPDNVKMVEWVPQQDVLRHPNIKLFITQGGLLSIEEAIYNSIPMVVIPFLGDQGANAYRVQAKGIGLYLDHNTLTKEKFRNAILEVIENDKYKKSIEEISRLTKDQPMTGLEKLVWWTEYVIRHKGAKYFKNEGRNLPLYQYFLLDVIAFFVVLFIIIVLLIKIIFRLIKKLIFDKTVKIKVE